LTAIPAAAATAAASILVRVLVNDGMLFRVILEGMICYRRSMRLGALDGEAGAGEAAGAAVERSPARLHPRRDRVEVVGGRRSRGLDAVWRR
jgi:hypothetical protein